MTKLRTKRHTIHKQFPKGGCEGGGHFGGSLNDCWKLGEGGLLTRWIEKGWKK
jgi:hypothetical protein